MEETMPTPTNLNPEELSAAIESVIFVAEEPMTVKALTLLFAEAGVAKADVLSAVSAIRERYEGDPGRGIELREVAGGLQFRTKPTLASWIQKLNIPKPTKLSQPSLETLSIIAYRQPIVRSEIEEIRGVDSGQVLKTLLERDLIKIIGKRDDPGSPLIYATTETFLSIFNLNSLEDLPSLKDVQELERPTGTAGVADAAQQSLVDEFPIPKVDEVAIAARESVDGEVLGELEDQIRDLRKLERVIFPREETTLIAVPPEVQDAQDNALAEGEALPLNSDSAGADAAPEDIGSGN